MACSSPCYAEASRESCACCSCVRLSNASRLQRRVRSEATARPLQAALGGGVNRRSSEVERCALASASDATNADLSSIGQQPFEVFRIGSQQYTGSMLRRRFGSNERVDAIVSARGKPKRARETSGPFLRRD